MGDDRPSCYYEDDVLIIRASAIGSSCLWELVAAGQGYEPSTIPDFLQRAFDKGHELEPVITRMLEKKGWEIYGSQDEGHLVITPTLKIRYHPDGMTKRGGIETVVEIKALSDVLWSKAARHSVGDTIHEYKWQLSVMMHANNAPAVWVAFNKGNSNGDPCPDQGRLLTETVVRPPISLEEIVTKAKLIKELIDGDDIMVTGRECDDPKHFPCRYLHLRPEPNEGWLSNMADDEQVVSPGNQPIVPLIDATLAVDDEEKQKEIDYLVREYLMHKGIHDESKTKYEAARDRLVELSRGHNKLMTDHWLIPIIQGTNSSPDWAGMPEDIAKEAKKYVKKSSYKYVKGVKNLQEDG